MRRPSEETIKRRKKAGAAKAEKPAKKSWRARRKERRGVKLKESFDWGAALAYLKKRLKLMFVLFLLVLVLVGPFFAWQYIRPNSSPFSINRVHITWKNDLHYLDVDEVKVSIGQALEFENFVTVNVGDLQEKLQANPWVKEASVKRKWYNELEIEITEEEPVARWNDQLVDLEGNLFKPKNIDEFDFIAIESNYKNRAEIVKKALEINEALNRVGLHLSRLKFDEREAWTILLKEDVRLLFGTEGFDEKFALFIDKYPEQLQRDFSRISQINFHYNNSSFAITHKKAEEIE